MHSIVVHIPNIFHETTISDEDVYQTQKEIKKSLNKHVDI
jgi:hypothetical protein